VRSLAPHRIGLSWHRTAEFTEPGPASATEIEARFTPASEGTHVELEHRALERQSAGAERIRQAVALAGRLRTEPRGLCAAVEGF
jgi:hypothetical protein